MCGTGLKDWWINQNYKFWLKDWGARVYDTSLSQTPE